jgi:Uma2 family endonuclease
MSQARQSDPLVTIAQFDAFLEAQRDDALWELVAGQIVAMTNPTEEHEQIVANIGAPLKLAMDAKGCRAHLGGMRVQRSDDTSAYDKPRPDIVVRCGLSGRRNLITDPLVIVEVLSPTTMDIDRGGKLRFTRGCPRCGILPWCIRSRSGLGTTVGRSGGGNWPYCCVPTTSWHSRLSGSGSGSRRRISAWIRL